MKIFFQFAVFLLALFTSVVPLAAQSKPAPKDDRIRLSIVRIVHTPDGNLLLAVKIAAKAAENLSLHGEREKPQIGMSVNDAPLMPFSLAGSFLTDTYDDKRYNALPNVPDKPFFGPLEVVVSVQRGGFYIMGVAFPPIPPPPPDKEGKPQDYKLMLHTPLDAESVLVTFPSKS